MSPNIKFKIQISNLNPFIIDLLGKSLFCLLCRNDSSSSPISSHLPPLTAPHARSRSERGLLLPRFFASSRRLADSNRHARCSALRGGRRLALPLCPPKAAGTCVYCCRSSSAKRAAQNVESGLAPTLIFLPPPRRLNRKDRALSSPFAFFLPSPPHLLRAADHRHALTTSPKVGSSPNHLPAIKPQPSPSPSQSSLSIATTALIVAFRFAAPSAAKHREAARDARTRLAPSFLFPPENGELAPSRRRHRPAPAGSASSCSFLTRLSSLAHG